ncbi:MAG: hypothetical protein EA402_01910 [Planctomycetota bacterium]|nr:MAG: hypothetical protein EA402_01910 [Planctomycetota bacterium]
MPINPHQPSDDRLVTRNQVPRPFMGRRETILVMMIAFAFAVVLFGFWPDSWSQQDEVEFGDPIGLREMPYPKLAALENRVSQSDISAVEVAIAEYLERPDRIFGQPLPVLVGWAQRQLTRDAARQPIPMRVGPSDIGRIAMDPGFSIRAGSRVAMSGQVVEILPFAITDNDGEVVEQWQRLLVEAAPQVHFQVLASGQAAELPYGAEINVVGRYLGTVATPVLNDEGATVLLPTMAAQTGTVIEGGSGIDMASLLRLGVGERPGTGPFRLDPTVFDDVDDMSLRLERRAYYYLLGLIVADRTTPGVYNDPLDANRYEQKLHHGPENFRGHPVTVRGQVLRAWEDWEVARDRPFGVQRVIRMWLWALVPEERVIQVDGRDHTLVSSQPAVYDLAIVVGPDVELPQPRDQISATGRFLKVQRQQVTQDFVFNRGSLRNTDRALSDSVYFKFIVAGSFSSEPPRTEISTLFLQVGFLIVFTSLLIFIVRMIDADRRRLDDYKKPLRKLRANRRALAKKRRLAEAQEAETADASEDLRRAAMDEDLPGDGDGDGEEGDEEDGDHPRP